MMKFPFKLHEILSNAEKNGQDSIISWLPDGISFKVHKREQFEDEIMTVCFNQTRFKSFQRSLQLWGFKWHDGAYSNEFFLRDDKELCSKIIRNKQLTAPHRRKKTRQEVYSCQTSKQNYDPTDEKLESSRSVRQDPLMVSPNLGVAYYLDLVKLRQQYEMSLRRAEEDLLQAITNS